jgi:hypothetical protein
LIDFIQVLDKVLPLKIVITLADRLMQMKFNLKNNSYKINMIRMEVIMKKEIITRDRILIISNWDFLILSFINEKNNSFLNYE